MSRTGGEAPAVPRILVLGLGNSDRGDDGIGPAVAAILAETLPEGVELRTRRGDMLGLMEDWAGFDAVICIDAAAPAGAPGRVHRIELGQEDLPPDPRCCSNHGFGIADAIGLARALALAPPTIIVYAIEGRSFALGAAMTSEVANAAAEASGRITAECRRLRRMARMPPQAP
jgi:hydrogenase maturation protease